MTVGRVQVRGGAWMTVGRVQVRGRGLDDSGQSSG